MESAMKVLGRLLSLVGVIALAGCERNVMAPPPGGTFAPPAAAELRSPWDETPVKLTQAPYMCGPVRVIAPDLTVTTSQNKLTPAMRAAVYAESDVALHDLTSRTVTAADFYRHTGSQAAALCVISLMTAAAQGHAMAGYMADDDAWQEQNMALRAVTIAYLKVRDSGVAKPYDEGLIDAWLDDISRKERDNLARASCGAKYCAKFGRIGLSVASGAASVGVAANDRELFRWAIDQYREAVKTIDDRGMMTYDTHGNYALKFNLVSAADLVQIAELGETNGEGLYAFDGGRIHLLVHTVSRGLIDPNPFSNAAGSDQRLKTLEPWQVSWAAVYNKRFPDAVLTGLLQQVGPRGADMWGGEPWVATAN
jgi:poly(beta-D-mannuronate) lyase